ncbi:MAG: hypothetical protein R3A45_01150 [Bdellovibrionota bacterium]
MIRSSYLTVFILLLSSQVLAYAPDEVQPSFLWVSNPSVSTGLDTNLGVGLLNSDFSTGAGTSIFFDATGNYAVNASLGFALNIPLAGTVSDHNDDFGLGNISLQGKYFLPMPKGILLGLVTDVVFPTATSDARIGTATRAFYRYTQNQWAIVPRGVVGIENNNLRLTGQIGAPIQMLQDNGQFDGDPVETNVSYDVGAAVALADTRDLWVTVEVGGYTTLTRNTTDQQTEIFGSLGTQYQDDEKSFGLSVAVPFTQSVRDVHSMFLYGHFAYHF